MNSFHLIFAVLLLSSAAPSLASNCMYEDDFTYQSTRLNDDSEVKESSLVSARALEYDSGKILIEHYKDKVEVSDFEEDIYTCEDNNRITSYRYWNKRVLSVKEVTEYSVGVIFDDGTEVIARQSKIEELKHKISAAGVRGHLPTSKILKTKELAILILSSKYMGSDLEELKKVILSSKEVAP